MNGEPLLPDHGFPVRLVLPGWVGIASIKWLGSLEVASTELTSPWNTKWYRMTGGFVPGRLAAADRQPGPLGVGAGAGARPSPARPAVELTGRSWSGAAAVDAGRRQRRRRLAPGSRRAPYRSGAPPGLDAVALRVEEARARQHVLMARATDAAGRTQPLVTPFNDNGYFFDAVVKHPVTVA